MAKIVGETRDKEIQEQIKQLYGGVTSETTMRYTMPFLVVPLVMFLIERIDLAVLCIGLYIFACFMMAGVCNARALAYCQEKFGHKDFIAQRGILESGLEGEKIAAKTLQELPDDYVVFPNLNITYEDRASEMDFVVVGPTGVFVVEAKNHNGTIRGDIDDHDLIQEKVGEGGTPYSKTFYNPVKQVGTHVYRLAGLLRANGMGTHVSSAVYFTNADLDLSNNTGNMRTPVYTRTDGGDRELRRYITEEVDNSLSVQQCSDICSFLTALQS